MIENTIKTIWSFAKLILPAWCVAALRCIKNRLRERVAYSELTNVQRTLDKSVGRIARNLDRKIRVGFFVVYDKTFQLESVFRLINQDPDFEAMILVIPDVSRGEKNMSQSMHSTYDALHKKYGDRVMLPYKDEFEFLDFSSEFDLCFVMNPYAGMSHALYSFEYLSRKGVLVAYSNYAFGEGTANAVNFDHMHALNFLWRFYLDREPELERMQRNQRILSRFHRLKLVGAAKTDTLSLVPIQRDRPKTIVFAPHHSIPGNGTPLSMGNFDTYASFFLSLPERYPQIHWIFRPHPLLFWTMRKVGVWQDGDEERYLAKLLSFSNVTYQSSGDYYEAFVNSDGMIQDSGSFLAEYHVSGHPQCYILRDRDTEISQFNPFGREMLSYTYKAYSEKDIIDFIENVVIAGKDPMKEEREKFAKEKLMFNYPHASEAIVADIKKALGRG